MFKCAKDIKSYEYAVLEVFLRLFGYIIDFTTSAGLRKNWKENYKIAGIFYSTIILNNKKRDIFKTKSHNLL